MESKSKKAGPASSPIWDTNLKHVINNILKLSLDKDSAMDVICLSVFGKCKKTGCDLADLVM